MTLTLELPPDVMKGLADKAEVEGKDAAEVAGQALAREFGPAEPTPAPTAPAADDWDMPYTREQAATRAANARAVFAEWAKEDDEADAEEELREWEQFKRNMNESRRLEGRPPAYPPDQYPSAL